MYQNKNNMVILINKDFKKKEEKIFCAEQVSCLINQCEFISNPHLAVEEVNIYNHTVSKVQKNKNYYQEYQPFLFFVNKN